jgi:hypothetical protein
MNELTSSTEFLCNRTSIAELKKGETRFSFFFNQTASLRFH